MLQAWLHSAFSETVWGRGSDAGVEGGQAAWGPTVLTPGQGSFHDSGGPLHIALLPEASGHPD